jgi:hypothetical protein
MSINTSAFLADLRSVPPWRQSQPALVATKVTPQDPGDAHAAGPTASDAGIARQRAALIDEHGAR